jgi:hypothetical protein
VVIDPIRDDEGVLLGFAKVTRDNTERRQAQQALEEARARAVSALTDSGRLSEALRV